MKTVRVPARERQVLTYLARHENFPVEMGGGLDFNKHGKLERIHVQSGKASSIQLEPDFEVLYHTHPIPKGRYTPPASPEDILSLAKDKRQQAEIVVARDYTDVITKTPASIKALSRLPATSVFRRLDRAYTHAARQKGKSRYRRTVDWYNGLGFLGFRVIRHPNTGPLTINDVTPVEPRRHQRD